MAGFEDWLHRRGQQALRQLWREAQAPETPPAVRLRLLEYFADMGVGKAKTMEATPADASGCGVVILPAVMSPEDGE